MNDFLYEKLQNGKNGHAAKFQVLTPRGEGVNRMPQGNFLTTPFFVYDSNRLMTVSMACDEDDFFYSSIFGILKSNFLRNFLKTII